jgi:hypothetical protein
MAQSEWLVARALRLQGASLNNLDATGDSTKFALYIRYQTTHERAFYKALNEFQKLREQKVKAEIGFASHKRKGHGSVPPGNNRSEATGGGAIDAVSVLRAPQELKKASQNRAVEALNLKKEEFQFKKEVFQTKKGVPTSAPAPEKSPGRLEMAA